MNNQKQWAVLILCAATTVWAQPDHTPFILKPFVGGGIGTSTNQVGMINTLEELNAAYRAALYTQAAALMIEQEADREVAEELWMGWSTNLPPEATNAIVTDPDIVPVTLVGLDHDGFPSFLSPYNVNAAATISLAPLQLGGASGLELTGTNTLLGIFDYGDPLTNHVELAQRVTDRDGDSQDGITLHATHVAGTMAGGSTGMARQAPLHAWDYHGDTGDLGMAATEALRPIASNHSYGETMGWAVLSFDDGNDYLTWLGDWTLGSEEYKFGFYSTKSQTLDRIIYGANDWLPVFATGNDRGEAPPAQPAFHLERTAPEAETFRFSFAVRQIDGHEGFDCLSPQSVAKNVLSVGAIADLPSGFQGSADVLSFSNVGPTDDRRIKPDLVANGEAVQSASHTGNAAYASLYGTSMAAPGITGAVGLLGELHTRFKSRSLWASSYKALLIHTADDLLTPGPDIYSGWGVANVERAATVLHSNHLGKAHAYLKEVILNNGDYVEFPVVATTNTLKVTICWTDPEGTPVAPQIDPDDRMLVNDLDLRLIASDGITNRVWMLNPDDVTAAALVGDNIRDNVEQVCITNPLLGEVYTVRVTHKGNLVDQGGAPAFQRFSMLLSGIQATPPVPLRLEIMQSGTQGLLRADTIPGQFLRLQESDDLTETWHDVSGEWSVTKTNTVIQGAFTNDVRFYRLLEME